MCGIVGSCGLIKTKEYIIEGLKALDYRGYDSAGIGLLAKNSKNIEIIKYAGSVENLESKILSFDNGYLGIGHTRWATHGKPSDKNSHPHLSMHKLFAIVHNGVIENYLEIKKELIEKGYVFNNDTDTEVVANLIEDNYLRTKDVLKAIQLSMTTLIGSYAIACIFNEDNEHLYILKNASPLLVGIGKDFSLVASDATPMIKLTNRFVELDDKEYGVISNHDIKLFNINGGEVEIKYVNKDPKALEKDLNGYPHFMLKEIEECENAVYKLINEYHPNDTFLFDKDLIETINKADHIAFIACGTSYHASLVGVRYFEHIKKSASSYIASEWAFYPSIPGKNPFIIFISQSGETADVIHCLKICKEHHYKTLVITNTKGSTLERNCDYSILLYAGLEVSVASTKAYVSQVTSLALLTNAIERRCKIDQDLINACKIISYIRSELKNKIKRIAYKLKDKKDIFYLGRGYDYFLSLEASLKLKEISYIHSEAFAAGELKHGPIALIEKGTPVLVFITDQVTAASMRGNVEEVKSRGADVYIFSTKSLAKEGDTLVVDDYPMYLSSVAVSTIAFYFAYYVSLLKGLNVDKPRNLAKSVTVE